MNLNNDSEILEDLLEKYALQLDAKDFACRSKAKTKITKKRTCWLFTKNRSHGKNWIDIEQEKHSFSEYEVSKNVIHLFRQPQKVHREKDGAVHFFRMKENLQNPFPQSVHWSDDRWKACLAAGGGAKRRFHYWTDDSGTFVYFRALQGHSKNDLINFSVQVNVVIPRNSTNIFYHFGCAFNFSFHHQLWMNIWRSKLAKKQNMFLWLLILWTKVTRILMILTWKYHIMHNTCTMHGSEIKTQYVGSTSTYYWERIAVLPNLVERKYFSRNNFQLILFQKLLKWNLEKSYTKKYTCHFDIAKDLIRTRLGKVNWVRELLDRLKGISTTPRRKSYSTSKKFPTTPTNSKSNSWMIGTTW